MSAALLPRHIAIGLILLVACVFGANHVAARLAFDHGTGLLVAVLCRSGFSILLLLGLLLWQRPKLSVDARTLRWQLLLGALIATQSLCLYSAVARIPVALALLISNVCPLMLAMLTWALGGPRPSRGALGVMALTLCGLVLALDVPTRLQAAGTGDPWLGGILFALAAATAFTCGLWITDHRLKALPGLWRSVMTIGTVFALLGIAGVSGWVPGGMDWPDDGLGWSGLAALVVCYGSAFTVMFVCLPRLDMARNAPAMNIEPVATLFLAWAVLGQTLGTLQLVGGGFVLAGIVLLSLLPRPTHRSR